MDLYIKQLVEAFDFNSVKKLNKNANAIDVLIKDIVYRIIDTGRLDTKDMHFILSLPAASYKANNNEIHPLVTNCVTIFGDDCNLNWIDVSNVTNMNKLFADSTFNGDISNWDVSNVTDMGCMFETSKFKGDISKWDVSSVIYMDWMFYGTLFNGDISKWDVRNVKDMHRMFLESAFNSDISDWNVSNVIDMHGMFLESNFNRDISNWNIENGTNVENMFDFCSIKKEYKPKINVSESFEFGSVEKGKKQINACDILLLHIFNLLDELQMITEEEYNILKQYTGIYKVKDRHDLKTLIIYFTQSIGADCDLNWMDISNITDMSDIFWSSEFNGDISKWDVSNVTTMTSMFDSSDFNGDISGWNISNVTDMRWMFYASKFNRDLSKWIIKDCNTDDMFKDCPIKDEYYPQFK